MKTARAQGFDIQREDGSRLIVPPLTWGQWQELLLLDSTLVDDGQPLPAAMALQLTIARLEIILRDAACTDAAGAPQPVAAAIRALDPLEARQIYGAAVATLTGVVPPQTAADLQVLLDDALKKKLAATRPGSPQGS